MKDFGKLVVAMILPFAAGAVGSYFTFPAITSWYAILNKPSFSPPNWVFGPVWTILYVLMGVSFYLVWSSNRTKNKQYAIKLFLIQLLLNASWSIAFFGLKNPSLAFINIIALWFTIFLTIRVFYRISKTAAYLLYTYILWVSFAMILNISITILN